MANKKAQSNSEILTDAIVSGIQNKKGHEITILDLRQINNSISDFYVICHGASNTQVDALADSVIEVVNEELSEKPIHVEGRQQAEWILLDFSNVMVHVFQKEIRTHYALEELWADAIIEQIEV